jgi:O-antigen ligase
MLVAHILLSVIILFLMVISYGRMPYLVMFGLLAFLGPYGFIARVPTLRWTIYVGFVLFGFLYGQRRTMRKFIMSDLLMLSFVTIALASYLVSLKPDLTIKRMVSVVLMYSAFFFGLYTYVDSMDKLYRILRFLLFGIIIYNVLSIMPGIFELDVRGRLVGLSSFAGKTAAVNAFMLPIALAVYLIDRKRINLFVIFFVAATAYFTYARAAFACMLLSSILFYAQYFGNKKLMFVITVLLALATALVSFYLFGIWLPERLVRIETLPLLGGRLEIWGVAREIIARRPLIGFGFGTEELVIPYFGYRMVGHPGGYLHTSFLGLAVQLGVPATVIFFGVIFYFTISLVRFTTAIENRRTKLIGLALSGMLFVGLLYCFSESWIYSAGNDLAYIYYIVAMLAIRFKKFVTEDASLAEKT